jgi:predicted molibdopterin-dependent oxidoreductase YjgC
MFRAAREGRVKAMLLMGDHVHYEDGTLGDVSEALGNLDFLVVTDTFLTPAAEQADVVFPAAAWAEKFGSYTNLERRVQPLRKVLVPKNTDARSDLDVLCGIAREMGARGFDFWGPEAVLEEIGALVPEYAGITHPRLMADVAVTAKPSNDNPQPTQVLYSDQVRLGIQWPCADADAPGTAVLYEGGFRYGKAQLGELKWFKRREPADDEHALTLLHGRVLAQSSRPADVRVEDGRNTLSRTEELVLNTVDAEQRGIEDGEAVTAMAADGWLASGIARVSDGQLAGTVSLTTLFAELAEELDRSERPDPMNHVPRLRSRAVKVEASERSGDE